MNSNNKSNNHRMVEAEGQGQGQGQEQNQRLMPTGRPKDTRVKWSKNELVVLKVMLQNPQLSAKGIAAASDIPLSTVQRKLAHRISSYLPLQRTFDGTAVSALVYVVRAKCDAGINPQMFSDWSGVISAQMLHAMDGALVIMRVVANTHEDFIKFLEAHKSWNLEVLGVESRSLVNCPLNLYDHLMRYHANGHASSSSSDDQEEEG